MPTGYTRGMIHPLDSSEPARRLLVMASRAMAEKMRVSAQVGEAFDKDDVLSISVGVDVLADGRCSYVAHHWTTEFRGEILDYGTLPAAEN